MGLFLARFDQNAFNGVGVAHRYKILYFSVMKPLEFLGSSLDELRAFTPDARHRAGYQLDRVQRGLEPEDFKPMPTVGAGVYEIRVRDEAGTFRVMYVAKFEQAVYVLHAFQKKTQKTTQADIELTTRRYRELLQELRR